jgi:O-antigen/teichoic acid export membrane protein
MTNFITKRLFQNLFAPANMRGSVGAQAGSLLLGRSLGYLRGVLLTWLLVQHEFGLFQIAVAIVNLLVPLSNLGLSHGTLRYAPAHEARRTLAVFARRASVMVLSIATVTALILLLLPTDVAGWAMTVTGNPSDAGVVASSGMVRATVLCMLSLVVFHLPVDLMKGLRLFRAASLMEIVGVSLFSVLAVGAPLIGYDSAESVLLTYGVGNILSVAFFAPSLIRYIRSQPVDRDATAAVRLIDVDYVHYSLWIAGSLVSWHLLQQFAFLYLAGTGGLKMAGVYFAVRLFAQLVFLGGQTLARVLSSNVTRVWESTGPADARVRLEAGTKVGLMIVFAGVTFLSLVKPFILLAYPTAYAIGVRCFDPLLLAYGWFAALEFLIVRFHLRQKSMHSFLSAVAGVFANLALGLALLGMPAETGSADLLIRAAWICAFGSGVSVTTSLVFLFRTADAPHYSTILLLLAIASIGAGSVFALVIWGVTLAAMLATDSILSPAERLIIANWRKGL